MGVLRLFSCVLASLIVLGATQASTAKSCQLEYFEGLCYGCTITLDWKIKRFLKSEEKRWCLFNFATGTSARKGFKTIDGFSLGELRTGIDNVGISGLKTGRDRVTVQLQGLDKWGRDYVSTIHFNVEVVEGEF